MNALESVMVPYRDLVGAKSPPKRSMLPMILLLLGVVAAAWFAWSRFKGMSLWEPAADVMTKSFVPPFQPLPLATASPVVSSASGPLLKQVPSTINLIRGGGQPLPSQSPEDLARTVALAVKETLMTFPQLKAPTIASIVQQTVKIVLADSRVATGRQDDHAFKDEKPSATSVPQGGRRTVSEDELPIVDTDEVVQEAGVKQGKINVDSNPQVLKMLKERGLDKKT